MQGTEDNMEGCVQPTRGQTREVKLSFKAKDELEKKVYLNDGEEVI